MNMKKGILAIIIMLLVTSGLAQAEPGQLSGTLDVTYLSRYIWRGIDTYANNHSGIQPSLDLDLYGTGFGINVLWSRANGSDFENEEEIDYTVYYTNRLFDGECYATDYVIGWVYYNYPDGPKKGNPSTTASMSEPGDQQEVFGSFSWPNICPAGIVPSYTYVHVWQSEGGSSAFRKSGGPVHIFGLGYDMTVCGLAPDTAEQIVHLSADVVYNDGTGAAAAEHDFSHAVFGISTGFDLGNNLTFTPGFYYQSSWEDSINTQDEYWTALSLSYAF